MEQQTHHLDLINVRDLLTIVFKYKYKIIFTAILIFIAVTLSVLSIPRVYEAKSVLLIKFGREFFQRPEAGVGGEGLSIPRESIVRSEINILMSRDLINQVIRVVGIENIYPGLITTPSSKITPAQQAAEFFDENLNITSISNSSLIQVTFTHPDPQIAAKVVNALVDTFKDKHLEVFSGDSTGFLENQQKTYQKKLRDSEDNLASFKQKNNIFSFEEQISGLMSQRNTLDTSLKITQNQISELEEKIAFMKSPRWIAEGSQELKTQLAALQQRERELVEKYTDNSRTLQNLRREIKAAKDSIDLNIAETRKTELTRTENELGIVKARAESLRRQLGQIQGEIRTLDGRSKDFQELKREAALQGQSYETYAKKLEESLIMDDMDKRKMVAISVIEKATPNMLPKKQRLSKRQMVAAGFFGGIAAGIALAFLLEFTSPGMTTPMSAEKRLNLPVMVAITKKE